MKYVILIYNNLSSREMWEQVPAEDRRAGLAAYRAIGEELESSGEIVVSEALALPVRTTQVVVRDGVTHTTDGPFAEAKEHLAGFFLVDVPDVQRAVEIASRIPEAHFGVVEVRPTMDLSAFEQ